MSSDEILAPRPDDLVRAVGRAIIEHGLGEGRSLFSAPSLAWSPPTVGDLYQRYNLRPDAGTEPFMVKLRRQLDGAPDDTVLLVAELLTLQALPLSNFGPRKKRERINEILSWMRQPGQLPTQVSEAFSQSTWSGGTGAHTLLWRWLANAVEFTRAFAAIPEATRRPALTDPWAWSELVHRLTAYPSLRESLLYLAFPGSFLPIVNTQHKSLIRKAFADRLAAPPGDLDRDLFQITLALQRECGGRVDFYLPPFVGRWRPPAQPDGPKAWLVRPRQGGPALVERWRAEGFISIAATHIADLTAGADLAAVRRAVEIGYQHRDAAQRQVLADEFHTFLSRMQVGHVVATTADDRILLGVIADDAVLEPDAEGEELRRGVDWQLERGLAIGELPHSLRSELDKQGTVVDLTGVSGVLSTLLAASARPPSGAPLTPPPELLTLPAATVDLASHLHIDQAWLQMELVDLLSERRQVILHGPPGTGKTYLAQAIARHVTGGDAIRLVQFHPSYSYEDFFEGFRPVAAADGTASGFELRAGPMRELSDAAHGDPQRPYVLIIDEINRANLAKVFGELYFLLEYRDNSIRLQYSPAELFQLPSNVYVIGTMNTADRSVALVDAAIRRRFAFVELHPDEEPIHSLLPRWLHDRGESMERAALLEALNATIAEPDRDFKIGPAYLMRTDLDQPGRLERVWRHDLLPTLEEHYFGRLDRRQVHERFGLDAIRARLRSPGS